MALKLRSKEIKKSSYYVWFLGAKESKGLRGSEYILPVVEHLEEREKDVEPFKVTLQVSHKGLKIVQNVVVPKQSSKPKNETIKHFIPHNTITCVYQQDDVIACILLLFNPVTKCPLHVHAYRCDSLETAALLKSQLQALIEKPENQKKFAEIEGRLRVQDGRQKKAAVVGGSSIGSDTGASTRESESSEERYAVESTRVTTLYDSVAAELRAKLGKKNSPILLPPRDYDTVHRTKGNLTGIELRRCLNANIVGQNGKAIKRLESSGGSSGIGSDHPPSPDSPDAPDSRFNTLDNHSTSDEEWNGDPADSTVYLMHHPQVTLPRPGRDKSPEPLQRFSRYAQPARKYESVDKTARQQEKKNLLDQPMAKFAENKHLEERQRSRDKDKEDGKKSFQEVERERYSSSPANNKNHKFSDKYYYRGDEHREKYGGYHDQERFTERRREKEDYPEWRTQREKPTKYFDDDGFDENMRSRSKSTDFGREPRYSYDDDDDDDDDEEEYFEDPRQYKEYPVPKARQRFDDDEGTKYYPSDTRRSKSPPNRRHPVDSSARYFPEHQKDGATVTTSRRSASDESKLPRDRFKDAKEKFLSMERERLETERGRPEPPISPVRIKEKPFAKRFDKEPVRNMYDNRYYDSRADLEEPKPRPAPRQVPEEVRHRERFREGEKYDAKRRSMFSSIEDEHRKNSNDIARELKRRSYMDGGDDAERYSSTRDREPRPYQDYPPEADRFAETDKVGELRYAKHQKAPKPGAGAGYRHSYAEPQPRPAQPAKKHFAEMLHRTNSSAGNNGRVGIASVHPY